ncbi:DUF2510 domain-containing protein [Actinoplanes flavus]|uniref:DUF2510 domain-containing protein n=1 Tax=Actinoplanes flavus TaxID=2820290 RepID=A0ABS3UQY0_9ACTN|nr:DUF2510 domain-containing protein [Actinoplanes flavus]MBO3741177.1 DUF2510 domain-containing protein [Actinoplanes flavus]
MSQPAGWYADPSGLPAQRWWDGGKWTDHIQPGGPPTPPPNGFFPPVPPTGPAAPGRHTVAPGDPDDAPLRTAQPASARQGGLPLLSGSRSAPPAPHPEVPAVPYAMPPVDAAPGRTVAGTPEPLPGPSAREPHRMILPAAVAVVALVVLTLTAYLVLL